jgi:low temperature requirement protein LtrA
MSAPDGIGSTRLRSTSPTVSWFELFYDLVVVAAVSLTNDAFLAHPSVGTGRAAVLGIIALSWVWFLTTLFNNIFPGQDLLRRFLMLVQMGLIIAAALAIDRVDEINTRTALLAYAGALLVVLLLVASDRLMARGRRVVARFRPATAVPLLLAIGLCTAGAFADPSASAWFLPPALVVTMVPVLGWQYPRWISDNRLRLDHLRERLGLFILIILGEGFAQLVTALHSLGTIPRAGVFALTFLVSFALWWIYFDGTFSERLELQGVRWRLSLLGHLTLVFGMAGTLDILVLVSARRESEYGPLVLPYFTTSIATVLLSFALLRFAAKGTLGISGILQVTSGLVILVTGLALAAAGAEDLYAVIGACAVIVVANGVIASWSDRERRDGSVRAQLAAAARGADYPASP